MDEECPHLKNTNIETQSGKVDEGQRIDISPPDDDVCVTRVGAFRSDGYSRLSSYPMQERSAAEAVACKSGAGPLWSEVPV